MAFDDDSFGIHCVCLPLIHAHTYGFPNPSVCVRHRARAFTMGPFSTGYLFAFPRKDSYATFCTQRHTRS